MINLDHDLWWLEGILYKRNKVTDTPQNIMTVVNTVKADIQSGKLVGAFVHRIKGVPIVFVHAGYSPNFYTYMKKVVGGGGSITAEDIVNYTNVLLQTHTSECNEYPCKNFDAQLFEAGPDRGGRAIGGPL